MLELLSVHCPLAPAAVAAARACPSPAVQVHGGGFCPRFVIANEAQNHNARGTMWKYGTFELEILPEQVANYCLIALAWCAQTEASFSAVTPHVLPCLAFGTAVRLEAFDPWVSAWQHPRMIRSKEYSAA